MNVRVARLTAMTRASAIWRVRAELLVTLALLGGWGLLTWGIAELTTRYVWQLSAGVFLLSCCGWRFLRTLVMQGLYFLTREKGA